MEEKQSDKKQRTVIHLELIRDGGNEHYYFGSIANIYEYFSAQDLGIGYGALRNYGLSPDKSYKNSKCLIRKGILLSKNSKRGEWIKNRLSLPMGDKL